MILGPIVLGLRCDRCFEKHLKCNRVFPECDQCTKQPSSTCTYTRRNHRKTQTGCLILEKNATIAELKRLPKSIVPFGVERAKPLRTFLNVTMTFLMFPSLASSPMLYVSIARRYQSYVQTLKRVARVEMPILMSGKLFSLLSRAENAYFDHVNDYIGLFPRSLFDSAPRSNLLRASIISCGLFWCDEDPMSKQAQAHFTTSLAQNTIPSRLPLTLDTIQSLLVLMIGMFGNSWVTCRMDFFYTTAVRAAYSIGLHIPRKNKGRIALERQLASNCLLYYLNFFITSNNPSHVHLPHLSSSIIPSSEFSFLFAFSLATLNAIFPDIVRLKFTLVENMGRISASEVEGHIKSLETRLTDLCLDFMIKLNQLTLAQKSSVPRLPSMMSIFSFYHAYYAFIISSMRLYRTTTSLRSVPFPPPGSKSTMTAVLLCTRAISWALKVDKSQVHLYFVAKFSQLLIFMSHNRKHASPQQLELMNSGLLRLRSLQDSSYSGFIGFRLFFLDTLSSLLPAN